MKTIEIDRTKQLFEEPNTGHNRFHSDIPPVLEVDVGFAPPKWAAPQCLIATTGLPVGEGGINEGENLILACRNALRNMIDLLQERRWSREQAYIICSVAVDLRISNVVNAPNYVVSALLPEEIFQP